MPILCDCSTREKNIAAGRDSASPIHAVHPWCLSVFFHHDNRILLAIFLLLPPPHLFSAQWKYKCKTGQDLWQSGSQYGGGRWWLQLKVRSSPTKFHLARQFWARVFDRSAAKASSGRGIYRRAQLSILAESPAPFAANFSAGVCQFFYLYRRSIRREASRYNQVHRRFIATQRPACESGIFLPPFKTLTNEHDTDSRR